MNPTASFILIVTAGTLGVAALVAIDKWLWRQHARREVDSTWESFSDGRWRE